MCFPTVRDRAPRLGGDVPASERRERARELRALGEDRSQRHRDARRGARADGIVSGRQAGRIEVLTEDYLPVYLPTAGWDGCPRFDVTVE
jgi:hypothetical protein